jgi:hypothetical protein
MTTNPDFDVAAAHRFFAAHCFNQAWELIEKPDRSPEEDRLMVALNQASIFHWLNRPDCGPQQLSVGYWQASRIQAVLGNAVEAQRHAEVCLSYSTGLEPFYIGYAYEALARAAVLANHPVAAAQYLARAQEQAALITEDEDRDLLRKDLTSLL